MGTSDATAYRRANLFADVDLHEGRTLEIGPLDVPLVTSEMADVRYVDVVNREGLMRHFADDPSVDTDAIPEIHHWLTRDDGTVTTLVEAVQGDAPFQHVVACHVIEHVPDLIGWLGDISGLLAEGGDLLLVVPDRRFCFDARRSPATTGQILQAHHDGDRTPSVRAVYDHVRSAVDFPAVDAWRGDQPPGDYSYPFDAVMPQVERQRRGEYVDVHVWPMTPVSFVDIIGDLLAHGLIDFTVERIVPTAELTFEFFATLRRLPDNGERDRADDLRALSALRATLPDEERSWPHQVREAELLRQQEQLERQLASAIAQRDRVREKLVQARTQRDRARAQRVRARTKIARLQAQRDRAQAQRNRARRALTAAQAPSGRLGGLYVRGRRAAASLRRRLSRRG